MAVVNTKSAVITAADAQLLSNANVMKGSLLEAVGTLEAVNGDSIGSTYRLNRIPSNARVSRVLVSCDAITTCAGDVGIYRTALDGGAVVKVDHFGSAVSLAVALVHSDITHEADPADAATQYGLQDTEKMLWQALGLTVDPKILYDVVVTLTAAAGSAGTVGLKTQYAI